MKNSQLQLILLCFIAAVLPNFGFAQDSAVNVITYEVNKVFPPLSITKEQFDRAETLADLNPYFKPSWVKEYQSVEISTIHKGKVIKTLSENDVLSPAQKERLNGADVASNITVNVLYLPDNNLKNNELKKIDFSFKVEPENDAEFTGGPQALKQYLAENALDGVQESNFQQYALAAIKFKVDEAGKIINPTVFESAKDEKIDDLLLKTVSDMPDWKPAAYASGLKVKQEFVYTVGDRRSCVVNLLSIRQIK